MLTDSVFIDIREIPIIYINIDEHTEKRSRMESMFLKYGLTNVHRSPGIVIEEEPVWVNIAHAFNNAFTMARTVSNGGMFLMLEDDVVSRGCFRTQFRVPIGFDALYLGASTWGMERGVPGEFASASRVAGFDDILRIHNMLSGHAILYSGSTYTSVIHDKMNEAIRKKTYQDIEFAETMREYSVYSLSDPIFYQTSSQSVTDLNFGDFLRANNRLR